VLERRLSNQGRRERSDNGSRKTLSEVRIFGVGRVESTASDNELGSLETGWSRQATIAIGLI